MPTIVWDDKVPVNEILVESKLVYGYHSVTGYQNKIHIWGFTNGATSVWVLFKALIFLGKN